MNCTRCRGKITRHLWVVDEVVFCSPKCERGKGHRYSDKVVESIGCAGLKKPVKKYK